MTLNSPARTASQAKPDAAGTCAPLAWASPHSIGLPTAEGAATLARFRRAGRSWLGFPSTRDAEVWSRHHRDVQRKLDLHGQIGPKSWRFQGSDGDPRPRTSVPRTGGLQITREPRVAVQTPGTWCRLSASGRAPGSEPVARSCGFGRLAISARTRPCLIGGDDSHHGTLLIAVAMVRVGGGDSACLDPVGTPPGFRDTVDPVQGGPHDQVVRGSVEVAHQALSQNRSRNPTSQRCSSNPRGRLVVLRGTRAGGHEETYAEHNRLRTPGTPMLGSPCQT
jgi:hypothetical protein